MKTRTLGPTFALAALTAVSLAAPQYRIEALTPSGDDFFVRHTAGGYTIGNASGAPLLLTPTGSQALTGPAGYSYLSAEGLNRLGTVVGAGGDGARGAPQAMVWRNGGVGEPLPTFNGTDSLFGSGAIAINDSGTIVGIAETSYGRLGVVWQGDDFRLLKGLDPDAIDQATRANAINASGLVAGSTGVFTDARAAVWDGDQVRLLGGFDDESAARDVNDLGVAVGYGVNADGSISAFVNDGATTRLLPTLNGLLYGDAAAVNNAGLIVGSSATFEGAYTATLWQEGQAYDLNSLLDANEMGWTLESAVDIDDDGSIVGIGSYNGEGRMFRMTPVPEPASLIALGGGLAVLLRRRRRMSHS